MSMHERVCEAGMWSKDTGQGMAATGGARHSAEQEIARHPPDIGSAVAALWQAELVAGHGSPASHGRAQ